jgi:hypothetical protein
MSDDRLDRVEQLLDSGDVDKADQLLAPMVDELNRMGLLGEGHDPRVDHLSERLAEQIAVRCVQVDLDEIWPNVASAVEHLKLFPPPDED